MTVPIAASPGRSGFGPQLALSYDSGGGNGPFGFGWNLSLPAITRKTDKGLPRYNDLEESDVFILSGAEDLVPVLVKKNGGWEQDSVPPRVVDNKTYIIKRYRPRIEGLFARIERWTNPDKPEETFWRSISKDNITTWYGKTGESRIVDPADHTRIFSWLICESYDDKGNVISYRYQSEDGENVDLSQAHEQNRGLKTDSLRSANRYLKSVFYGNRKPYLPKLLAGEEWPAPPDTDKDDYTDRWMFEVVFDYEEGHYTPQQRDTDGHEIVDATTTPSKRWAVRNDPFSSYRAGFEVRTYRLCQRALMFHHFPGEAEVGANCLVRSTDFDYSYEQNSADPRNPIFSFLRSVTQSGYKRQVGAYLRRSLPPLEFEYTSANIDETVHEIDPESLENLPYGIDGGNYQWIDLDGEGLSGILTKQADSWFYKRNLGPIHLMKDNGIERAQAKFAPVELVGAKPNAAIAGGQAQFMDLAGDGQPDLVLLDAPTPGFYEHDEGAGWNTFRALSARLNRNTRDPNLKFIDLDGDGHADVLIMEDEAFTWHPSLGEEGFGPAERVSKPWDEEKGPAIVFADATQSIYLADFSGDGLTDLVRIRNGAVCYWPNLGYGRFGAKVAMDNSPWFDHPDKFDQKRIRLADIDGSGVTDIIYLHDDGIRLYFNQSGNSWSDPHKLEVFPRTENISSVAVVDLLGNGTACLVWSSPLPEHSRRQMRYVDLMGGQKPHLLVKTRNNLGAETEVQYAPSTRFYLRDKLDGKPWITRLPFPVHCVEKVTVFDKWRNAHFTSTYSYHHGYFDGIEREFRGFGRVEQVDTDKFGTFTKGATASPYITNDHTLYQPPVKTTTWFHTGAFLDRDRILSHFKHEYFPNWFEEFRPGETNVLGEFEENDLPEPDLNAQDLTTEEWREALRACKGMPLRQEIYELDPDALEKDEERPVKLFSTAYHNCHIKRLQPKDTNRHAVFLATESETITYHYELDLTGDDVTPDPRIAHTLNLKLDELGNILQSVAVAYPRTDQEPSFVARVLADRPIAYYRFGEAAGSTRVSDLSGNDNSGDVSVSGVTLGAPGLGSGDSAALFDGREGRIIVLNSDSLNPPHITMEAKVRWDGPHSLSPSVYQRILEKSSFPELAQYGFGILPDGHVRVELRTSSAPTSVDVTSVATVAQGAETHIAATYDGKVIQIYLNGLLDSETSAPGGISPKPPTPFNLIESGLGIGNQTQRSRPFNGIIDELALYDTALSAERIRAHIIRDVVDQRSLDLIREAQKQPHLAYTETRYTNDVIDDPDSHRLRAPCEVKTYELTGFSPAQGFYFDLSELRDYRLSDSLPDQGAKAVAKKLYHEVPQDTATKRLVEHMRTLFFDDDATGPDAADRFLKEPLQLGKLGKVGLTYEQYKLALTKSLLDAVFGDKLEDDAHTSTVRGVLGEAQISGYLSGAALADRFHPEPTTDEYWMRSGVAGFNADADRHFYLPELYTDPFGNTTRLNYDDRHLYVKTSADPLGNTVTVTQFDFRVLAPSEIKDPNDNYSAVAFDTLGMPVASSIMGKNRNESGDNLTNLRSELTVDEVEAFFTRPPYEVRIPRDNWQRDATARYVYDLGEKLENGRITYGRRPAGACGILREKHLNQLNGEENRIQVAVEYSDGLGAVLVKKAQAEPAPEDITGKLRWIASGKTILNNKGKPVKQFEPYYSKTEHRFDEEEAASEVGVTPIMYYDAPERLVRTELPDGSFSRVEFSPWHVTTYDQNDTAYDPSGNNHSDWYKRRTDPTHPRFAEHDNAEDRRAADLAKVHANTPSRVFLDSLGREVVSVAHNKFAYQNGGATGDEKYVTFTKLDTEGKPLWIRDARGNLVMQYISPHKANDDPNNDLPYRIDPVTEERIYSVPCYDIAGNLLFQHSMDAEDRWMLNDAAGKPMFAWDNRGAILMSSYDELHRPTKLELKNPDHSDWILIGLTQYGEGTTDDKANNRRGKPYRGFDQSGVVANQEFDFKGNALRVTRRLAEDYDVDTDWRTVLQLSLDQEPGSLLMQETFTFTQITEYDALNRMTLQYNWRRTGRPEAVYKPRYNERGLLTSEELTVGPAKTDAIKNLSYNEKGQRLQIRYGNNVATDYTYDTETFRLLTLVSTRPNKPTLQNLSYTYDPGGNITEIFDAAVPTEFFNGAAIEPRKRFVYDALYQLIEATGREHAGQLNFGARDNWNDCPFRVDYGANNSKAWRNYVQRYTYDSVGNILVMQHIAMGSSANSWTRQYQYAADSNRLLSTGMGAAPANRYATAPTLDYRYGYNAHGSMTSMPHLPTMDWDYTEHLRYISRAPASQSNDPDGCTDSSMQAWYRYDANNQRARKRVVKQGGIVEERFYLGGLEWYRRTLNGELKEEIETLHLFDGERRLLMVDQVIETDRAELGARNLYRYTLSNHIGSSTVELDDNAEIISYEEYHPYGTTAYQSGRNAAEVKLKRYQYTGMERDEESGLNYHKARYYATWLSRWTTPDPQSPLEDINCYRYVHGDPIAFFDPTGNSAFPGSPEQHAAFLKIQQEMADKPLPPLSAPIKELMQADKRTVLALMPDGTGYVGPAWVAEQEKYEIGQRMAFERWLQTGRNIASGPGGAIGYGIGGDKGSDVGAFVDAALTLGTAHPLNSQSVVNAPTPGKDLQYGAPTHVSNKQPKAPPQQKSPPKQNPPANGAGNKSTKAPPPTYQPELPPAYVPLYAPKNSPRANWLEGKIAEVRRFFRLSPSDTTEVGLFFAPGFKKPVEVKSGHEGGPWVGTQFGSVPRGKGSAYSAGGPSESNIGTHVEGHAIQGMWATNSKQGILIVGSEPCGVCSPNIAAALPPGSQLIVIHPDKENPGSWTSTYYRSTR
jgi:RHS repeat-associated protein